VNKADLRTVLAYDAGRADHSRCDKLVAIAVDAAVRGIRNRLRRDHWRRLNGEYVVLWADVLRAIRAPRRRKAK
jgi:hypothetical protein